MTPPLIIPRLFCFGLGYTARVLARHKKVESWGVAGTTRRPEEKTELEAEGFQVFLMDRGRPLKDPAAALAGVTHVLSSVPPDEAGDAVLDQHLEDLRAVPTLEWVGYLSTTGVYGDTGGRVVDETAPVAPTSERSRRRAEAERRWLDSGLPVHVFRLPGIYGPHSSTLDKVRSGKALRIDRPGHRFCRIHVEDIAETLVASMARPNPGAVYNVCDDLPASPAEVTAFACELLGAPVPPALPYEEAVRTMSPMALSFWNDNRVVDNSRIKRELGVALRYTDYRAGLRAVLEMESRR